MTKNGWPTSVVPLPSYTRAILGWSIKAAALPLGVEPGASTGASESIPILISLSRHLPLDRLSLTGPVNGAHSPLAEDFEQCVPAGDDLAHAGSAGAIGLRGAVSVKSRRPICLPLSPVPTANVFPHECPRSPPGLRVRSVGERPVRSSSRTGARRHRRPRAVPRPGHGVRRHRRTRSPGRRHARLESASSRHSGKGDFARAASTAMAQLWIRGRGSGDGDRGGFGGQGIGGQEIRGQGSGSGSGVRGYGGRGSDRT